MRTDYIRIYKALHTWTGILCGMALFIAFYAGALTVFKVPLDRWISPPVDHVVPIDKAQELIVKTVMAQPESAKRFVIDLRNSEDVRARMTWEESDPDADDHDTSSARHFMATLGSNGESEVQEVHPSQLSAFIDVLHRVVGLPVDSDPNRWLMGVVAVLYALALVSGVVVLVPTLVADFFALRVGKNLKRMWLDAHNVIGIISLPFHIVMALTAVVFAYHDQIYAVQDKLFHEGRSAAAFRGAGRETGEVSRDPATLLSPLQLVEKVHAIAPGFKPERLEYQGVTGTSATVRIWGKDDAAVMPRAMGGFIALDPYSGNVRSSDFLPGQQNTSNLWISSFFALHMASFGGSIVNWLYFLLGMAGAWLFYSGNLLWIESRRRAVRRNGAHPVQRRDTRFMAAATVGICLGCVCGISLTIVASKWLQAYGGNPNAWLHPLYYSAFFASVTWSFFRGGAVASVHLLWSASVLTALIPITSLLALLLPGLGLWAHGSTAAVGVDVTALAGAMVFALMAKATARRVYAGASDSVWSASQGGALSTATAGELRQDADVKNRRTSGQESMDQ
jgi:uncharacterized iron-regulated membrane protein